MTRTLAVFALFFAAGCTPSRATDTGAPKPAPSSPAVQTTAAERPDTAELKARLTPLQFEVTQHAATEPPFRNAYWDNHADGIYVDVVSGEPLFSSRDKFESGTGWPSFTRPITKSALKESADNTLGMERTEVVARSSGSHLGHVFDDGPAPTHLRYCMNSAAMRFIPAAQLAAEGYGQYAASFGANSEAAPPPATSNSCTVPPPGKKAGCNTTLEVAVFAGMPGGAHPSGVLDIVRGHAGTEPAFEVTFDPAKISHDDVVRAWSKSKVVGDASAFRRDKP